MITIISFLEDAINNGDIRSKLLPLYFLTSMQYYLFKLSIIILDYTLYTIMFILSIFSKWRLVDLITSSVEFFTMQS